MCVCVREKGYSNNGWTFLIVCRLVSIKMLPNANIHYIRMVQNSFLIHAKLSFSFHLSCRSGFFECAIFDYVVPCDREWETMTIKCKKKANGWQRKSERVEKKKQFKRQKSIRAQKKWIKSEWNGRPKMWMPNKKKQNQTKSPLTKVDMRLHWSSDSCIQCRLGFS